MLWVFRWNRVLPYVLPRQPGEAAEFGFLQVRPLTLSRDHQDLSVGDVEPRQLLCQSSKVLGNGASRICTTSWSSDSQRFERSRSQEVAKAVAHFNGLLNAETRPYLLIGVGRWGSNDPWLGIPVEWDEISGARVIVEAGFRDFRVTPSQAAISSRTHRFSNRLLHSQSGCREGSVDWEWLSEQSSVNEDGCVRHLRFDAPMRVVMNSKTSQGVIFKPQAAPA